MPEESTNSSKAADENIKILSLLSESLPSLLHSAGSAISLLTDPSHSSSDNVDDKQPLAPEDEDLRKELFTAHVKKYYSTLRQVQSTLMKQTAALEKAGIIPTESPSASALAVGGAPGGFGAMPGAGGPARDGDRGLTNGGMGKMEVNWLKSQAKDVGREREREVVRDAKDWLKKGTPETEQKDEAMADG